jgi:hypothetical protein
MEAPQNDEGDGVQFQVLGGKRSSQAIGKHVFAEAAGTVESSLADRIAGQKEWRKNYIEPVRDLVAAGARSAKDALRIATEGLNAAHESFVFKRGDNQVPLSEALKTMDDGALSTAEIRGEGERWTELAIPYRGKELRGDQLLERLESWENAGIIEPSCAEAVRSVVANPSWLDMSDTTFVLLGAASEMGPLEWLSRWGAKVIAVDLPRKDLWERIVDVGRKGAGVMHAPVRGEVSKDPDALKESAGADLLSETPEIHSWLSSFEGPLVMGNYAYADGSTFLRLAAALDSLTAAMQNERSDVSISYLATPTDAFAVPEQVVEGATTRRSRLSPLSSMGSVATAGRAFRRNYRHLVEGENGRRWGIADCLVPQQGPNYALAKMVQRWRATVSKLEGHVTSANVAPATLTRSVVRNRVLAAAYRGASPFGVEIFAGATSRALMAALLAHDLRNPKAPAQPGVDVDHPYDLFADGAAHGGLWRMRYEPRSVLPLAVGLGMMKRY